MSKSQIKIDERTANKIDPAILDKIPGLVIDEWTDEDREYIGRNQIDISQTLEKIITAVELPTRVSSRSRA